MYGFAPAQPQRIIRVTANSDVVDAARFQKVVDLPGMSIQIRQEMRFLSNNARSRPSCRYRLAIVRASLNWKGFKNKSDVSGKHRKTHATGRQATRSFRFSRL